MSSIQASVERLNDLERSCYFALVVFPVGSSVPQSVILMLWKGRFGLSHASALSILLRLEQNALLSIEGQPPDRRVSLREVQHDFLIARAGRSISELHGKLLMLYANNYPAGWHTLPNDGYSLQHTIHHFVAAGRDADARRLLMDLRWHQAKLDSAGLNSLLEDLSKVSPDEIVSTVKLLLKGERQQPFARHATGPAFSNAGELCGQIVGRLKGRIEPEISRLVNQADSYRQTAWLRPLIPSLQAPAPFGGPRNPNKRSCRFVISTDNRYVVSISEDESAPGSGQLKIWDAASAFCIHSFPKPNFGKTADGQELGISKLLLTPDDRFLISVLWEGQIWIWEIGSGSLITGSTKRLGSVSDCRLSPDGRELIMGMWNGDVTVWPLPIQEGRLVLREPSSRPALFRANARINQVALGPDEDTVVIPTDSGTIHMVSLRSGLTRALRGHEAGVNCVAFTRDRSRLVSASDDKTIKVWDLATGDVVLTMRGHEDEVRHVAVTADGRCISAASGPVMMGTHVERLGRDPTLRAWSVNSGKQLAVLGEQPSVNVLRISQNERFVVSASGDVTDYSDDSIKIWDLNSMKMLARFVGDAFFEHCTMSNDNKTIITDDYLGSLHFLRLELPNA